MKKLSLLLGLALGLASTQLALAGDTPSSTCPQTSKKCDMAASCPLVNKKCLKCHKACHKSGFCPVDGKKCCMPGNKASSPVDYSSQNSRAALTRLGATSVTPAQCPKCHHTPCCCK